MIHLSWIIFYLNFFFLVFLFYYVWGFFLFFFIFFKKPFEFIYLKFNQNFLTLKRDFNDLSFFEKLFLVFFSKNGFFKKSIGNIYSNSNLFDYRKKKYPLIFFFHLYSEKSNYKFNNLKILKKFFKFFNKPVFYNRAINKINHIFFENKIKTKFGAFILFLILQKFLYKRYYNLCGSIFFKTLSDNNLIKLNWMFWLFLVNSNNKCVIYDLSNYSDWYDFNFKKCYTNSSKINLDKNKKNLIKSYKLKNFLYLTKIYRNYNFFFKKLNLILTDKYKNIFLFNFNELRNKGSKLTLNNKWLKNLNFFYPIRFAESSINKNIELDNVNNYLIFYIRKNRIFNKGRYSRNRQLYRTGVYWCLWLNIILVYGLYFLFYRFTFNFGYFWWGLMILFYSTIFSRAIKYNYHNVYKIFIEFSFFFGWLGFIFFSLKKDLQNLLFFLKFWFTKNIFYFQLFNNLYIFYKNITKNKFVYFWENLNYKDNSLFKYKTLLHWLNQFYKLIIY